jgi:DNA-binding response OmpR family regulator
VNSNIKILLALSPDSSLLQQIDMEVALKRGFELLKADTVRDVKAMCLTQKYDFVCLESNFSVRSEDVLKWGKQNTNSKWIYFLRGDFSQALSQLALRCGASLVLHEPKSLDAFLIRLRAMLQMEKSAAKKQESSDVIKSYVEKQKEIVHTLKQAGNYVIQENDIDEERIVEHKKRWRSLLKEVQSTRQTSFVGYDSYKQKYSDIFTVLSQAMENVELSFLSLRPNSILDNSYDKMKLILSSHENEVQAQEIEDVSQHPEISHTIRTQEAVIINNEYFRVAIPITGTDEKLTGVLVAKSRMPGFSIDLFVNHAFDLYMLTPKIQRALNRLEYFSRLYSQAA